MIFGLIFRARLLTPLSPIDTVAKRLLADAVADASVPIGTAIAAARKQSAGSAGRSIDLEELARGIINSMPQEAEKYRKGKKAVLARLIGQGMKETKGAVDASALGQKLQELLSET
jgi:Asp-tRNA(Asn)/Glu-tRNA(Gln) amidotransferase B subunit